MSNELLNFNIIYFYNLRNYEEIKFSNTSNYPKFQTKLEINENIYDTLLNKICIAFNIDKNKKDYIEIYIEKNNNFTLINNEDFLQKNNFDNNEQKLVVLFNYMKIINDNIDEMNEKFNSKLEELKTEFNNQFIISQNKLDNTNELIESLFNIQNENKEKFKKETKKVKKEINQSIKNFEKKLKENEVVINNLKNENQNLKKKILDNSLKNFDNIEKINDRIDFILKKVNNFENILNIKENKNEIKDFNNKNNNIENNKEKINFISIEYNKDKFYNIYLNDLLTNKSSIIEITLKNNGDSFWPNDCFIHQNINKNFDLLNNSLFFDDLPINNHEALAPQEEIKFKLLINKGNNFVANQNIINIPFTIINIDGISLVKNALTLKIQILEGDSNMDNEILYEKLFLNEKFEENGDPLITFSLNLDNLVIKLSEYNLYEKSDIYHQISPDFFDIRWNKSKWSKEKNKKRGGKIYNPPFDYIGHGLRVLNEYDNDNTWIGNKNIVGEWPVAYHGTNLNAAVSILVNGLRKGNRQAYKDDININKKSIFGEKSIGEGVYLTPKFEIADHYSAPINGYKCVLMCRVNPNKIRIPQNRNDYWILNGNFNEIRPYRLLIKKLK